MFERFWNSYSSVYRNIFIGFAVLLMAAATIFIYNYLRYPEPSLSWQSFQQVHASPWATHQFQTGPFDLTIFADNVILSEKLLGEDLHVNPNAGYLFLLMFCVASVMLLAILSTLPRFWFYISSGILIFLLTSLRLETLEIGGFANRMPVAALMVLLAGPGIWIQFFRPTLSFFTRLVVYGLALTAAGLLVHFGAAIPQPLLYLSADLIPFAVIGTAIFVVLTAHEIIAAFITLITGGFYKQKSLNHFLILSTIYLLNLWFAYWNKIGWIHWDFYLHPFVLLFISGILAIWGIRQQRSQYDNIIDADPFAVYGIMALALMAFGAIGYFHATANDPALQTVSDISLYGHLGYGMIFVIYIIGNFIELLGRNMAVYKVLYQPEHLPFFTYRFVGLIATLGFVFYNFWQRPINDTMAAYHNAVGDLYASQQNYVMAEGYYNSSVLYGTYNHHANYAIANIEVLRNNRSRAKRYYQNAGERRPSEMSFLNHAELLRQDNDKLQALGVLEKAAKEFPRSGPVMNALGSLYAELGMADSAVTAFSKAVRYKHTAHAASLNLAGLLASKDAAINVDSLLKHYAGDGDGVKANLLALANRQYVLANTEVKLPADSTFNVYQAALVQNYLLQHRYEADTAFLTSVGAMARRKTNQPFREQLLFALATAQYQSGSPGKAFTTLQEVAVSSLTPERFNNIMAQWALEQHAPEVALTYLRFAMQQNAEASAFLHAVALTEAGHYGMAMVAWDSLQRKPKHELRGLAESMMRVLGMPDNRLQELSGNEPFSASLYRFRIADSTAYYRHLARLASDDERARSIVERSRKLFARGELIAAIQTFRHTAGLKISSAGLYEEIQHLELLMLAERRELPTLTKMINDNKITFGPGRVAEKIYLSALLDAASGQDEKAAQAFRWLVKNQPFFSEGVVAAAEWFRQHNSDKLLPYRILAEALHTNPRSVKILQAYIAEAQALGFDEYAASAARTLELTLQEE